MSPRDYPQNRIQSSILEWTLSGKVGLVALKTAMSGWPHSTENEGRPLNSLRVLDVPRIIYLAISGFGTAQGNRPGFDLIAMA